MLSDGSIVKSSAFALSTSLPECAPQKLTILLSYSPKGMFTVKFMLSSNISFVNRLSRTKVIKTGLFHSMPSIPQEMVMELTLSPDFVVIKTPFLTAFIISAAWLKTLISRFMLNSSNLSLFHNFQHKHPVFPVGRSSKQRSFGREQFIKCFFPCSRIKPACTNDIAAHQI